MLLAQQSLRLLACAIIFFVALTSTRPTDDKILAQNSLHDQLEKKIPATAGIEPVTPFDIGFSFDHSDDDHTKYLQERAPVCIASLCCWYDDLRRWVCPARWPTTGDLRRRMVQKGNVGKKVSFFYTVGRSTVVLACSS